MIITSIDPGFGGAIAQFQYTPTQGHLQMLWVADMPVLSTKTGSKERKEIDLRTVNRMVRHSTLVAIEKVGAAPGQGVSSMFRFGFGAGGLHGVCAAHEIPVELVQPKHWQARARCNKDTKATIDRARELFPTATNHLKLKKHKDRAAALLIGYSVAYDMASTAKLVVSVR